mmetsp:Transcript_19613/g.29488  ORF Transcript_19613/g.29488 Transcript_19613/m.29488 type:complete len:286 (+) Transcript_19613:306-1163(+)
MRLNRFIFQCSFLLCLAKLTRRSAAFSGGYTEGYLYRLAQASSLSYLSMDKMASSPYYDTCDFKPVVQVVDPASQSGATIFQDSQSDSLVVACRGSANPKNFGTNLKLNLVPATRLSQNSIPENALVHEGFQDASFGLWRELELKLMDISSEKDIIFTGHSLGAATALLCGVHYTSSVPESKPKIITFAGPRLCNEILAKYLRNDALEGCDIINLVHDKDPVLANNQKLWDALGFENVGVELQCDPKSPSVYTEEKPKESSMFGNFAWNFVDHCNYMGVFVGPRL